MSDRDFKGVWIPKEIWLDRSLSALDKMLFAEIDSLDREDGCYASNQYFAEFCQCSESAITKSISKLKDKGYIRQESFDGRRRVLRSNLRYSYEAESENFTRQTSKFYDADSQILLGSNIYINNIDNNINNTTNNTSISNKSNLEQIFFDEFETLWKKYPRKKGKKRAYLHYKNARRDGTTFEEVSKGLDNYLEYLDKEAVEEQFIKYGSSWFCGENWEDEYTTNLPQQETAEEKAKRLAKEWGLDE